MANSNRFDIEIPAQDDYYDIGVYQRNLQKIAASAVIGTTISKIIVIPQERFNALETKENDVLYIVTGTSSFRFYYGSLPMEGSGSAPSAAAVSTAAAFGTLGNAVLIETEEGT